MLRIAAVLAAVALHPTAVPNFVQWHTNLWDAYAIARGERLRVAVPRAFDLLGACETTVSEQQPGPVAAVPPGTVVRLNAAVARCRPSRAPAAGLPPQVVGAGVATAIARLHSWGDNWQISFPPLPPTRTQYLYDAYRVADARLEAGTLQLDAALVPSVVRQSCPVFGLDTFPTYRGPSARPHLARVGATTAALRAARPLAIAFDQNPVGTPALSGSSVERIGRCVEWIVGVKGAFFDVPVARLVPGVGIQFPANALRVVIDDATGRVLAVERAGR